MNPNDTGISSEIEADLIALEAVKQYTYNNRKMTEWIIIAIILLYSYLTLLGIGLEENYENKVKCRESWLQRFNVILDKLQRFPINIDEQELITGYDNLCKLIDKLCLEIIEESYLKLNRGIQINKITI